jgi:hypothetical protein
MDFSVFRPDSATVLASVHNASRFKVLAVKCNLADTLTRSCEFSHCVTMLHNYQNKKNYIKLANVSVHTTYGHEIKQVMWKIYTAVVKSDLKN